ncbi:MAG: MBL fold metallo-hydrolase [Archangium sp.]
MHSLLTSLLLTAAPVAVHSYTAAEAQFSVKTWLVETPKGVVVIDTQFTVSEAKAARKKVESLKKPLLAVLLTHAHPDHVNGTAELIAGDQNVPVVALSSVKDVLTAIDGPKRAYWGPIVKDEYPKTTVFPTKLLAAGESVTFDGVEFKAVDVGVGESSDETVWVVGENAFVGDLVMNKVHPWLAEGHSAKWLESLGVASKLAGVKKVFPGHGEAGGRELFDWQKRYLEAYRANVKELAKGKATLDDAAKKELEARMEKFLPNGQLKMLVAMSADSVAGELASK